MSLIWLRHEIKIHEKRTPLTPQHAAELISLGHHICIESSSTRIFTDYAYLEQGCELVPPGSWIQAPQDAFILGLKNIDNNDFPLIHRHIYFAHAYNLQRVFNEKPGITSLMQRFQQGGGCHYDFEFLLNENNQRVTTFGKIAGLVGAALGIILYAQIQHENTSLFIQPFYENLQALHESIAAVGDMINFRQVSIAIIGASGRCGSGVKELLIKYLLSWDEYGRNDIMLKKNKAFTEYDILFNCAYVQEKISPFLTADQLNKQSRLKLIADISCETSGNNPLPLYSGTTDHAVPTHSLCYNNHPLHIMAIDNLPTFLPYESSISFSAQCLPYLKLLLSNQETNIWRKARHIFEQHINKKYKENI